ncbi:uncharacterized protein LOC117290812 isoform X1 [Asterias rubens]|uniref:uncharacterized protein LOC117290812 isoform X1 n=1 Tax=Asterias rubens TaxID=7604 RepID=UPI0014552DEC|nr:uncharacterized protein LOC117290812 isoform X1 [Asterias rubens]
MRLYNVEKGSDEDKLERSISLPRVLDDHDVAAATPVPDNHEEAHPGHRYFTPQPGRKKPQPPPRPGIKRRQSESTFTKIHEDKHGATAMETDTEVELQENRVPNGHVAEVSSDRKRPLLPTLKVAPTSEPLKPEGSSDRKRPLLPTLKVAPTSEPLKPVRKAPGKPPGHRRRKSDTHVHVIEQLKKQQRSLEKLSDDSSPRKRGSKVIRSASNACDLSTKSSPDQGQATVPRFFTPQPTRRKFNLATVSRTPSFNDPPPLGPVQRLALKTKKLSSHGSVDSDHSPTPSPRTPVSPLSAPTFKHKKQGRRKSNSDSGHNSDHSSSPSPHTPVGPLTAPFKSKSFGPQNSSDSGNSSSYSSSPSPNTPVSPLAAPAFSGRMRQSVRPAPVVPDPQFKGIDFSQWKGSDSEKQWTKPERSNLDSVVLRNRPTSMPDKIRRVSRGSVNKSKQRQSGVRQLSARQQAAVGTPSSPAITRAKSARSRHQSAPAGRVAFALKHDPMFPVKSPTGEEVSLASSLSNGGLRRKGNTGSLRKDVLRSVSMERSRKMSLQLSPIDEKAGIKELLREQITPLGKADEKLKTEAFQSKYGEDEPDIGRLSQNGGSKPSLRRFVSNNGSTYSDYPSTFSTPTPSRHERPRLRRARSSRGSVGSLSRSMLASKEFLGDIFLSHRSEHKLLKRFVGFLTGLILGGALFLGLLYGLEYSLNASIVIASVSTLLMCLSLALTVRARCVASLMIPVLCTSRGRAAFLAIIVALLLSGPIDNIYKNANVASESMSCSAELAQNQTKLIKQTAEEVFDAYIENLVKSIGKLQEAASKVREAFLPIERAFRGLTEGLGAAGDALSSAADACNEIIDGAYMDCTGSINHAYKECKKALGSANIGTARIDQLCDVLKFGDKVCGLISNTDGICSTPTFLDDVIKKAFDATQRALDDIHQAFEVDVDFTAYWAARANQSQSFDSIQDAIEQELVDSVNFFNSAFSVVDKIIALSVLFLLFRSYQYHSKYRTKDRFDNYYVTSDFKLIDDNRRKHGKEPLLPLKKSERRRLIDLTSFGLSKPEKGLFRMGLTNLLLHVVIAGLLILADYGLVWLLALINRHGKVKFNLTGGGGADLTIGGSGFLSDLIRTFFSEGFEAANAFNITVDTEQCLPNPILPNNNISIGVAVLYFIALLMVLSQAYALRLRRGIASYFYPEREQERIYYLYNNTLQKRQSLFKLLKEKIKQSKRQIDTEQKISFRAYLSAKYPCWRKIFRYFGMKRKICLGCADVDNGHFMSCGNPDCHGNYCRECLHEIGNTCTLCKEIVIGSDLSIGVVEHRV